MIQTKEHPNRPEDLLKILNPLVKKWFFSRFSEFSLPQLYAVLDIHSRQNVLVSAPTGATKTLTGFLSILNELVDAAEKGILQDRVYCVYISPLKALNYDIEVNLLRPLEEIEELAGKKLGIRVGVRTGDTTQAQKSKMLKEPPHILLTTPESLAIMLTSPKFRLHMQNIEWTIVDEVHALAENKRGVHLSLTLEFLHKLSDHMTRVGLSATISPIEEIAEFLVGSGRDCRIIDVQFIKDLDLKVLSPLPNLIDESFTRIQDSMYEMIHDLVQEHKTTIIFTNTRAATERIVHNLKERYPRHYANNIGAHHGSLSKEYRFEIEQALRDGKQKVVVSSTSLELGIDIGYVDLVLLLGSPKSVARALQRCGRSGHKLHARSKGRIIVTDRDDLVECSVLLKSAIEKRIDRIHIPTNCLDVLAQQIIGVVVTGKINRDDLLFMIRSSYCYQDLAESDFNDVLDYLSGKHVSLEDRHIYAKIWYDDETRMIGKKGRLTRMIYMTNIGTIPDEANVQVKVGDQTVGTIDEAFLERLRKGDIFVLAGGVYQFSHAKGTVAYVKASVNRPPTVPSWFSDMLPLSFDLALEIGRFRRLVRQMFDYGKSREEVMDFISSYLYVQGNASAAIHDYLKEQDSFLEIPTDRKIIVETLTDREQTYYIFHTLFGRRVNDCLSRALAYAVSKIDHKDVEVGINDNGFYLASTKKVQVMRALSFLKSDKLDLVLRAAIEKTEVLKRRFRHTAARAFMILRSYKGKTQRVGRQQVSSQILINSVRRISNEFPILREARREIFEDLMDIDNSRHILASIENRDITIRQETTDIPSPFAFNLIMQGMSDVIRGEDRMEFLNRMHQNVLDKIGGRDYSPDIRDDMRKRLYSLTPEQRKLLRQLSDMDEKVQLLDAASAVIKGEADQASFDILKENQHHIFDEWPTELAGYIISRLKDDFDYDSFWDAEEDRQKFEDQVQKDSLRREILSKRLETDIRYDLLRLVDGDDDFSEKFIQWLEKFLSGTIPKHWSDELVKYLKKRYKDIS